MKKLYLALIALSLVSPAAAQTPAAAPPVDDKKLTLQAASALVGALRNLDGHMVIVKQTAADGKQTDSTVVLPWEFGSGKLRLRIANNLSILETSVKKGTEASTAIFNEVTKKFGVTKLEPGTPERTEYDRQIAELLKEPAPGAQDLSRIKASELNLDKNEIAGTVLQALGPILDMDVK